MKTKLTLENNNPFQHEFVELQVLPHIHDATVGINWDVINALIQEKVK